MHDLEEVEDEKGYKFYVNSLSKIRHKENPSLILFIKKIKTSYGDIKFASYRCAIKLIQLKNCLYSKSCHISLRASVV